MEIFENKVFSPDEGFRGAVYIEQNGRLLCEYAGGMRVLADELPNTLDTRFASASAGKVFVAVGILQLIERGLLRFDDTLGALLDIDLHDIDPLVTVRQLLCHTSGVPDYFDESVMDEYEELWVDFPNYRIRHNSDLLPLFIDKPMIYPRGERFQYNNTGYVLLAMVIEKLTGMEFDEYLRRNVFAPCGMERTGYFELDRLPGGCANNYIWDDDRKEFRTNIFSVDAKGTGAGGAFITVRDVAAFWRGLTDGTLLRRETAADMLQRHSGDGIDPEEGLYGYGVWIIDSGRGFDIPYFQGCDPGVSFISEYYPEKGIISVLVSNYCDNVWKEMRRIRTELY